MDIYVPNEHDCMFRISNTIVGLLKLVAGTSPLVAALVEGYEARKLFVDAGRHWYSLGIDSMV